MSVDPLDQAFGDLEELDQPRRQQLADLIVPFVKIHAESGKVGFYSKILDKLSPRQRVLILLLSRLALSTKNPAFPAAVAPKEVEDALEMPGGTVRPKLMELVKARVVQKDSTGRYFVRPADLTRAETLLHDVLPPKDEVNPV